MRLAQIARKVQTKPAEIRSFIKSKFDVELDADPNTKLDEDQVTAILEAFKVEEEEPVVEKVVEKKKEVEEIEVDETVDTDLSALKEIAEEEAADTKIEIPDISNESETTETEEDQTAEEKAEAKKIVEIQHADLEEVSEKKEEEDPKTFEEVEVDREAELIAARVDKLEGLKVVGKIDLSEPEPEEEDLPTADAIETEIDQLDGDVDTSAFTDLTEEDESEEKEAIFAELDALQEEKLGNKPVKKAAVAKEVEENVEEEEEDSIYKNERGEYRFSEEQKANRAKSLEVKAEKARIKAQKEKKKRHYQENVAVKAKVKPKKNKDKPSKKAARQKKREEEAPKGAWQKFLRWLND